MRSGIYKLYWEKYPHFYIGSSKDIDFRYKQHISALGRKTHTCLVQSMSDLAGLPKIEILEYCDIQILENRERYYYLLQTSLRFCLNSVKPTARKPLKAHSEHVFQGMVKSYTKVT